MTVGTFRIFQWSWMLLVILLASAAGALFPGIPTWAFLAAGLAMGILLLLFSLRIMKKSGLILRDERTRRNSEHAASLTFRVSVWVSILAIVVVDSIPALGRDGAVITRTLIVVMVFQYLFFLGAYGLRSRRDTE